MIECDIYSARLPEKTCALRYRNANGGRMRSGPGSDDPNCKVCSVGERLYREGWHKTTEPSFRDAADKRQAEEKPEKEESSMETQAEYGEKQKSAESAAAADTRTLVDPPGNHRDKNLLIDPATGRHMDGSAPSAAKSLNGSISAVPRKACAVIRPSASNVLRAITRATAAAQSRKNRQKLHSPSRIYISARLSTGNSGWMRAQNRCRKKMKCLPPSRPGRTGPLSKLWQARLSGSRKTSGGRINEMGMGRRRRAGRRI